MQVFNNSERGLSCYHSGLDEQILKTSIFNYFVITKQLCPNVHVFKCESKGLQLESLTCEIAKKIGNFLLYRVLFCCRFWDQMYSKCD